MKSPDSQIDMQMTLQFSLSWKLMVSLLWSPHDIVCWSCYEYIRFYDIAQKQHLYDLSVCPNPKASWSAEDPQTCFVVTC